MNETNYSDKSVLYWEINLILLINSIKGKLTQSFDANQAIFTVTSNIIDAFNAFFNISLTMNNMITSFTDYFRDLSNVTVIEQVNQIDQVEFYVRVSWLWITLSVFLIIAKTIFWLLVVFESKRHETRIWKTFELTLLFHELEETDRDLNELNRTSEMKRTVSEIKAKLARTSDDEWVLRRSEASNNAT